jgi:hypothetical protein
MYYGGARICDASENCPLSLAPANIGVVYSNDGIHWDGQTASYNPMLPAPPCNNPSGYGMPSAWNTDGASAIRLFWMDACAAAPKGMGKTAMTAIEGTHLQTPQQLTSGGLVEPGGAALDWWNAHIVVDSSNSNLYMVIPNDGSTRGAEYTFGVYRLFGGDMLNLAAAWTLEYQATSADFQALGFTYSASAAFVTNVYGDIGPLRGAFSNGYELVTGGKPGLDNEGLDIFNMIIGY